MSDRNPSGDAGNTSSAGGSGFGTARKPAEAIDEAPLVALAAGIAAGALIAALLPVTRREREFARPVGERVTAAARGAADAARRAGSDKLRELGLSPDAVADKVTEAGRATAQAVIGAVRDEKGTR